MKISTLVALAVCGVTTQVMAQTTASPYDYDWGQSAVRKMYGGPDLVPDPAANAGSSRHHAHRLASAHSLHHKDAATTDATGSTAMHTPSDALDGSTRSQGDTLGGDAHKPASGFDSGYPGLQSKSKTLY